MYKIILIILLLFIPLISNTKNDTNINDRNFIQSGSWVQIFNWRETEPSCRYDCVSIWYSLFRWSTPDSYGNYQYCYSFLSNSKWSNGVLANTGMQGTTIYFDGKAVTYLNYGIAGTNNTQQLNIYFKIHYTYIKSNSLTKWTTTQTYLN